MSGPDPDRFLAWLRDPSVAPRDASDPDGAWRALAADAQAYGERSRARLGPAPSPAPACGPGCPWCCYLPVTTTAPEAALAWRHARDHLDRETLAGVRERALTPRGSIPSPCPLLVEGQCSVHPARPLVCRAWNSTDAHRCAMAHGLGYETSVIPVSTRLRAVYANAAEALARGLSERGLTPTVDLRAALRELAADEAP